MWLPFLCPLLKNCHFSVFGDGLHSHFSCSHGWCLPFSTLAFIIYSEFTSPARLIFSDLDPLKDTFLTHKSHPFSHLLMFSVPTIWVFSAGINTGNHSIVSEYFYLGFCHITLLIFLPLVWKIFLFPFAHSPMKYGSVVSLHAFSPHPMHHHLHPSLQWPPIQRQLSQLQI